MPLNIKISLKENGLQARRPCKVSRSMRTLPKIAASGTKDELSVQIDTVHQAIADFYREIPEEMLFSEAEPEGWSPARNMKHVISTNRSLSIWISLPAFLIKLRGRPSKIQPGVDKISPTNRPGIIDYGKYPRPGKIDAKKKEEMLAEIIQSAEKVKKAMAKWSEEDLDRLSGLFGGYSLRTFVHFLLKHNLHHTNVVRARFESR